MNFDATELLAQSEVPIETDLRAYYRHPESAQHYVSFPVDRLYVDTNDPKVRGLRRGAVYHPDNRLPRMFTGDFSAGSTESYEFFKSYDLDAKGDISEYFIGVFRPTDSIAVDYFLKHMTEWDQEPTGVIAKTHGHYEFPRHRELRPYEYIIDKK